MENKENLKIDTEKKVEIKKEEKPTVKCLFEDMNHHEHNQKSYEKMMQDK